MKHHDLPHRWQTKLSEWIGTHGNGHNERLSAADFPCGHSVHIIFEDESTATFNYAFVIEAPELNEIGVFTEHCGYHIFPLSGTRFTRA